jgi:hypothetical protein
VKPKLYVETTIPSYLTAWPSKDLIRAGHQQITKEWWETRRADFDLYISQRGYSCPVICTPEELMGE